MSLDKTSKIVAEIMTSSKLHQCSVDVESEEIADVFYERIFVRADNRVDVKSTLFVSSEIKELIRIARKYKLEIQSKIHASTQDLVFELI